MRFRTLLSLVVLLPLLAASIAVISIMYAHADRRSTEMGERLLAAATAQATQKVHAQSKQAANLAQGLVNLRPNLPLSDSDQLVQSLAALLRANSGITWLSFSNPDGQFTGAYRDISQPTASIIRTNQSRIIDGKTHLIEFALNDDGTRTELRRDPDSGYDPRTRPFYLGAAQSQTIVWSSPYIFYNQSIPGISCSLGLYSSDGKLLGVFSIDYDLNRLSDFLHQVGASPHAQIMALTADRTLIAHSSVRVVPTVNQRGTGKLLTLADVEDPVTHAFQDQIRTLELADLSSEVPHMISFPVAGQPFIGCIMPVQLEDGPRQYVATIAPKYDFAPSAWQTSRFAILATAAALLIAMTAALILANRISTPLITLVAASEQIGAGDLDVKLNLGSLREFRHLTDALHKMLANLRDWVRVRTTINLAMEVQRRLLPAAPPAVPGFDIAGFSAYCDETGGDYYDYLLLEKASPRRFIVALGDVMGHGLPSALLMTGARGALRSGVAAHPSLGTLLTHLNALLHRDTDGKFFMTMCLLSFDLTSPKSSWASAGHDPPIVYDPATKTFAEPEGGDIPLAVMDEVQYDEYPLATMTPGKVFFLGSDGVWETANDSGELYGKTRLQQIIAANAQYPAAHIKEAICSSIQSFRGPAPVKDDITFIIIKT